MLKIDGDKRFIHYDGFSDSWDEWLGPDHVKVRGAAAPAVVGTGATAAPKNVARPKKLTFPTTLGTPTSTHYWFRPDGNVYFGTPPAGLGDDDFAALKKSDPTNCGTYELVGQALTLTKNGEEPEDHTYSPGAGGVMDSNPLSHVYRFKPGFRLEGTWGVNISSNFGEVAAFGANTWNFHKDGTFEHTTSGGVETTEIKGTGGAAPGQALSQSASIARGTYDFGGGKLILTGADGKTETHSASATDSVEKPRILNIDGSDLNQTR